MSTSCGGQQAPSTAKLLDDLYATFKRHMVITDEQACALALWVLHTYVYNKFQHTPRLAIISPEKRCGKSTLLDLLELLCWQPEKAASMTEAAMFRMIEAQKSKGITLLIDEADSFLPSHPNIRNLLNSGFEESGRTLRSTAQDGNWTPSKFSTFCPAAVASIGDLPDTVMDRSVVILLRRKTAEETVEKVRLHRADILKLQQQSASWAEKVDLSDHTNPAMPDGLGDRQEDIGAALLAIADLAGGAWPRLARDALVALFTKADEESHGAMLLADLRDTFDEKGAARLSSEDICNSLAALEHRPWAEFQNGRPITKPQLARLLAPFGISPKNIRQGDDVVKGYERADFADAWRRYLPQPTNDEGHADVAV